MGKNVSTRRIKKDRLYTYQEAGDLMGITGHTVRAWVPRGLHVMTATKPHYILGEALIVFIAEKQAKRASEPCLDKMYCFTCRKRRRPYGAMVDYIPINDTRGRLTGLCEDCEGLIHRFAGRASLAKFDGIYDIVIKDMT